MNYAKHIDELHTKEQQNSLLEAEPVLFSKFDSSIIQPGKPFFVPDWAERFDYETEIVVRMAHVGKDISERFAHRYWNELTVGKDFTARDLQNELRQKGMPWECCKGFDGSAVVGQFVPVPPLDEDGGLHFRLDVNGRTVQQGNSAEMLYSVDELIAYVSRFFTLRTGDLIFTGTPAGVGPVSIGDHLEGYLKEERLLDFYCR